MMSINRMRTVLTVVSVLLIVAAPYASSKLVQIDALLGFLAGIVPLAAGLILLAYSLKGQPLS
jgi:hypothetical protein